ncbi:MAG: peptidoglycan-binding protein LysM [Rhodothermales bacterium]|nr:peptidoglycan-binding protein LysM [Rhodothermales bacterium]
MGLISFLKNVGADIFKGGDRSEEIKELLQKSLGAQLISIEVVEDDGVVTLTGEADSQASKEKAALIAGNVKGIERVDDSGLTFPAPVQVNYYTIQKGDSLSKVAKAEYGDAMKYKELFEANREVIKDPDLIYPGQVIRIPALD